MHRELKQRLPGVPVFPSLGNYDFVPVHSDPGPPLNSWILQPLADLFADWLEQESLDTFRYAGYYEVRHLHAIPAFVYLPTRADTLADRPSSRMAFVLLLSTLRCAIFGIPTATLETYHSISGSMLIVSASAILRNLFQFVDNTAGREQLAWLEGVLKRSPLLLLLSQLDGFQS